MGVKIKNLEENDFKSKMIKLIGQTYLNCGFKLDEPQLFQTIDELCIDLQKYNSTLSFEEIELAFKNGYKKMYGDFFGLSNATYFWWVNAYSFAETRLKVKKTIQMAKENENQPSKKLSQEETNKILKGATIKSFEDFKNGAPIFDAGNVKYNFLDSLGLINFTIEQKNDFMVLAKANLYDFGVNNKKPRETIKSVVEQILPQSIKSEAKRLALAEYYKNLIEMEVEIVDILEENEK